MTSSNTFGCCRNMLSSAALETPPEVDVFAEMTEVESSYLMFRNKQQPFQSDMFS